MKLYHCLVPWRGWLGAARFPRRGEARRLAAAARVQQAEVNEVGLFDTPDYGGPKAGDGMSVVSGQAAVLLLKGATRGHECWPRRKRQEISAPQLARASDQVGAVWRARRIH